LGDHHLLVASDLKVNEAGKSKTAQNTKTLAWTLENVSLAKLPLTIRKQYMPTTLSLTT
jgi:hypothetical protein